MKIQVELKMEKKFKDLSILIYLILRMKIQIELKMEKKFEDF
jgi:hypothetical protein